MAEQNLVKVKLAARCYVDGFPTEKDTIVELPEFADDGKPFAASFGEIVEQQAAPKSAAKDQE